jgi:hypothetical protein
VPKFKLICSGHEEPETRTVLRKSASELGNILCPKCKHPMVREAEPCSTRLVEILDNGLMARRIERPAEAERLYKERSAEDIRRIVEGK